MAVSSEKRKGKRSSTSGASEKPVKVAKKKLGIPLGGAACSTAVKCFEWLIHPLTIEEFFNEYWEKKPLHIRRSDASYYEGLFGADAVKRLIEKDFLHYGANLNAVKFEDGKKVSYNLSEGEPMKPSEFESLFNENGCSIQITHPQQANSRVHALLERLENYFMTLWGSNAYYTPPGAQGFAPHYDDVEVFMLQTEGRKRWRLYDSPDGEGGLAREYSRDFFVDELPPPVFDDWLEKGDLLYFPRGTVHQGVTDPSSPSLHLTVSTYQKTTYGDLLLSSLPQVIERAMGEDRRMREGLPVGWMRTLSKFLPSEEKKDSEKEETKVEAVEAFPVPLDGEVQAKPEELEKRGKALKKRVKTLLSDAVDRFFDLDDIGDQQAVDFIALRTPPAPRQNMKTFGPDPLSNPQCEVRWRNPSWVRAAVDEASQEEEEAEAEPSLVLFYSTENDQSFHMAFDDPAEREPGNLALKGKPVCDMVKEMFTEWPDFIPKVRMTGDDCKHLWEAGVVETRLPEGQGER